MTRRRTLLLALTLVAVAASVLGVVQPWSQARASTWRTARPAAYQVTYEVRTLTNGESTTYEVVTAHRPFAGSDLYYPDRPATSQPVSGALFDVDRLYSYSDGGVHTVAGRQPGPAGSDQALAVVLPDLLARGLAHDLGTERTIAGRRCREYRLLEPPVGAIRPLAGDSDHADMCLDHDGLVLAQRWTYHGTLVQTRTALSVRLGTVTDPVTVDGATPLPTGDNVPTATASRTPQSFLPEPPAPQGFRLARAESFTAPGTAARGGGVLAASVTWAFVRGADIITVEAGTQRSGLPWDQQPTRTRTLTLAGLGKATSALRSDGPELRVDLGGGRWVRVRGTVPLPELVRYAQRITGPRTSTS